MAANTVRRTYNVERRRMVELLVPEINLIYLRCFMGFLSSDVFMLWKRLAEYG